MSVCDGVIDMMFKKHWPPVDTLLWAWTEGQIDIEVLIQIDAYYVRGITPTSTKALLWTWQRNLAKLPWTTKNLLPQAIGDSTKTLRALIREYLFVSLFRACAESLASENASRLASMQRADKNIDELLNDLRGLFYRVRQSGIDEELFEVVSGFEALSRSRRNGR